MCASMVLVGRSRTFQLMGCWIARGQVSCPRAAYKDFFEYWGVEGHRYMRFLEVGPDGETVDRLEQTVMRILGMDDEGNRVRRAHFGDAEAGEVSDPDGRASVEGVPRGRENGAQDAAAAESGAARAAAAVGGSGAAAAATVGGSDGDASAVVGESGAGAPATLGQSADRFGATPGNAGGAKDAAAAGRDGVTDAAFGEGSGGAGLLLADPEPASPPQPLLLGSFDQSWAAVRVPLMKKAVEASDEKYRRTGLSLLRPSPVLADYVDSGKNDTSAHKAPVLVEKEELALRWSGKRVRNRRQLLDKASTQGHEAGSGYLLKPTFKRRKRTWNVFEEALRSNSDSGEEDNVESGSETTSEAPENDLATGAPHGTGANAEIQDMVGVDPVPDKRPEMMTRWFMPRPPRRSTFEIPIDSAACAPSSPTATVPQRHKTTSRKGQGKTSKGAAAVLAQALMKRTFTKTGARRRDDPAASRSDTSPGPDNAAPTSISTADAAGDDAENTFSGRGNNDVDHERSSSPVPCAAQEQSAIDSEPPLETVCTGTRNPGVVTAVPKVLYRPAFATRKQQVVTVEACEPAAGVCELASISTASHPTEGVQVAPSSVHSTGLYIIPPPPTQQRLASSHNATEATAGLSGMRARKRAKFISPLMN